MKTRSNAGSSGFTLIELLVVIAIILVLAGILVPVAQKAIVSAKMTRALNNCKQVYTAVFQSEMLEDVSLFPRSAGPEAYANSTDLWITMVTNESLDVTFDFFGAPGLPQYHGVDPEGFTAANNAWCVTADLSLNSKNQVPLLFTRNLQIGELIGEGVADEVGDVDPFGVNGVVVGYKGGGANILKLKDLETRFNPHKADNLVLRPDLGTDNLKLSSLK
ncbi:MAG: prepilin-type N-terminal cleavage/methylation domain-containing protein [Kiritimatiellia bacterium]|jgi:prepilin-type N-terminal cleavage/methylation domain-containing protein